MTRAQDISLTQRDASVLGPLAEHRFLTVPQLAVLLAVTEGTATKRLSRLDHDGMLRLRSLFARLPPAASIETRGLRALGSPLKAPELNLNEYRHDVGVAWMWLAARAGSFGEPRGISTERRMQAEDGAAMAAGRSTAWGVGLGVLTGHGQAKRHYPDLMLDTASGHRVAVELELTAKSAGRMARIMSAYASDARVDHVLYLAATGTIATRAAESAARAGIRDRVHVQLLATDGIAGAGIGRARAAVRARPGVRERQGAER